MGDNRDVDVPEAVQRAVANLRRTNDALPELYDYRFEDEWQPERVGGTKTPRSRPTFPGHTQLHKAYLEVEREISRAHWALGRNTDVDEHWTSDCHLVPLEQAPTEPVNIVTWAVNLLSRNLVGLVEQDLLPPEANAVLEACGHANAAWEQIPHGFGEREHIPAPPVQLPDARCVHCGEKPPRASGKWCARCERAHGADRKRCGVCGLGIAA